MYRRAIFPVLAQLDAETAHEWTLRMLATASCVPPAVRLLQWASRVNDPRLAVRRWNFLFRNPIGVAAGLDKNAHATAMLLALGWGHVEAGTVTPLAQPGNPRPRVFRLPEDRALVNRMGFPGEGAESLRRALARRSRALGVVGVNIGANKQSVEAGTAVDDYVQVLREVAAVADYITINVSSPNTARLRALQGRAALAQLVRSVVAVRDELPQRVPLLLKLAPDLEPPEIDDILEVCLDHSIDGLVATNTTVARPPTLRNARAAETGGLSGQPLRARATEMIHYLYASTGGRVPLIGVGGVFSAEDVYEKLAAGASLVQVYTGLIYEGPGMARRLNHGLLRLMQQHGHASIDAVIGSAHGRNI
jgi:dihydroorotate dehydrogenase